MSSPRSRSGCKDAHTTAGRQYKSSRNCSAFIARSTSAFVAAIDTFFTQHRSCSNGLVADCENILSVPTSKLRRTPFSVDRSGDRHEHFLHTSLRENWQVPDGTGFNRRNPSPAGSPNGPSVLRSSIWPDRKFQYRCSSRGRRRVLLIRCVLCRRIARRWILWGKHEKLRQKLVDGNELPSRNAVAGVDILLAGLLDRGAVAMHGRDGRRVSVFERRSPRQGENVNFGRHTRERHLGVDRSDDRHRVRDNGLQARHELRRHQHADSALCRGNAPAATAIRDRRVTSRSTLTTPSL